jgi:single-strand DNA-binding protein
MNVFIGMGRLVNDPKVTVKENADETTTIARYRLAIDRVASNNENADFLSVVAFGKNAEFAEKYLRKGMKIVIRSHVTTGAFKNRFGETVYTTDFVADSQEFAESKAVNESFKDSSENNSSEISENIEKPPFEQEDE